MTEWKPATGDVHKLMREPSNINDSNAVAILSGKSGEKETQQAGSLLGFILARFSITTTLPTTAGRFEVIGHVPASMATWLSKFLKRPTNCAKVIIEGKQVNRGGGYGLEFPCEYIFDISLVVGCKRS